MAMSEDEPKKPRKRKRRPADEAEPGAAEDGSSPAYFLATCSEGTNRRLYRGYPDPDGISVIAVGPWLGFLDPEVARDVNKASWTTRTLERISAVQIAAGGVAILVAAVLFRLLIGESGLVEILILLLGFGLAAAVCALLLIGKTVRGITKRVAVLDSLSRAEIQSEASEGEGSFRVVADTVSNVRIEPDNEASQAEGIKNTSAVLLFRHVSRGKWRLILPSRQDARVAARAFRRFLGADEVQINIPLKDS